MQNIWVCMRNLILSFEKREAVPLLSNKAIDLKINPGTPVSVDFEHVCYSKDFEKNYVEVEFLEMEGPASFASTGIVMNIESKYFYNSFLPIVNNNRIRFVPDFQIPKKSRRK